MIKPALYRVSFDKDVCGIEVDESGLIIHAAPALKKFIGQHVTKLDDWLDRFPNATVEVV